ncbi:hypothetical protein E3O25_00905 [Cryobacterium sp. TMT1-3]|nr:hypothetical protein E3O25_00905 [Cryobacterium sp. TMT1-3]
MRCAAEGAAPEHEGVKRRPEQLAPVEDEASLRPRRGQSAPPGGEAQLTAAATIQTDGVVAGHRVLRLLGTGTRATVYLGHSPGASAVALKVFRADIAASSIELDIAVLTSPAAPGLVQLLDVAQLGDGRICLVLERLPGGSLARYLVDNPRLSPGEVVTLLAPVTVALTSLHTAGFAHGGLSLASILLDASGRAVLTGFGAVTQFNDLPRERMRLLRADYARLGIVMQSLVDTLDPAHPQFRSGAAIARRFQAATNLIGGGSGARTAGAPLGAILGTLERNLFDWADAAPLRGFHAAAPGEVNAPSTPGPAFSSAPRGIEPALSTSDHGDGIHDNFHHAQNKILSRFRNHVGTDPAHPTHPDNDDGFDIQIDDRFNTSFDTEFDHDLDLDRDLGGDHEFDDVPPRAPFGQARVALRRLTDRWAARRRTGQRQARLGRTLATVVDSHPLRDAGHLLRKRLHGHRRPLLVSAFGGASLLVLALTLFPVLGQAGETGEDNGAGSGDRASGSPSALAPANAPANPPADAAGSAAPTDAPATPSVADGAAAPDQAAIAGDDPVSAVVALLARRASCLAAASLVCLVEVDQTGSALLTLDSYDARERQKGRTGGPLADYVGFLPTLAERNGDLAVVALIPSPGHEESQPASVLVVKGEGGWRLREIFDY